MDKKLLISENEVSILELLLDKAENTKYGLITNWGTPYGITFKELRRKVEIMKYGEEYVEQKELEEAIQRFNMRRINQSIKKSEE